LLPVPYSEQRHKDRKITEQVRETKREWEIVKVAEPAAWDSWSKRWVTNYRNETKWRNVDVWVPKTRTIQEEYTHYGTREVWKDVDEVESIPEEYEVTVLEFAYPVKYKQVEVSTPVNKPIMSVVSDCRCTKCICSKCVPVLCACPYQAFSWSEAAVALLQSPRFYAVHTLVLVGLALGVFFSNGRNITSTLVCMLSIFLWHLLMGCTMQIRICLRTITVFHVTVLCVSLALMGCSMICSHSNSEFTSWCSSTNIPSWLDWTMLSLYLGILFSDIPMLRLKIYKGQDGIQLRCGMLFFYFIWRGLPMCMWFVGILNGWTLVLSIVVPCLLVELAAERIVLVHRLQNDYAQMN